MENRVAYKKSVYRVVKEVSQEAFRSTSIVFKQGWTNQFRKLKETLDHYVKFKTNKGTRVAPKIMFISYIAEWERWRIIKRVLTRFLKQLMDPLNELTK